ncbi:MAG: PASTA domain-containing protein, partial [Lentisphaerae bacterium]
MMRTLFIPLFTVCTLIGFQNALKGEEAVRGFVSWIVTIDKAEGLRDTDFGLQKTSDPFVELTVFSPSQSGKNQIFTTKTINNNLNPVWDQSFTLKESYPDVHGLKLRFTVYDRDENLGPRAKTCLGQAELNTRDLAGGHWILQLTSPDGRRLTRGRLQINVTTIIHGELRVPSVTGETVMQATDKLDRSGFRCKCEVLPTEQKTDDDGLVCAQEPRAGEWVAFSKSGANLTTDKLPLVTLRLHRQIVKRMPKLIGLVKGDYRIRSSLCALKKKAVIREDPSLTDRDRDRDRWFRVIAQDPKPGQLVHLGGEAILTIGMPKPEITIEMPNFVGISQQKAWELAHSEFLKLQIKYREVHESNQNGKVLAQDIPPGNRVKPMSQVILTVARYKSGLSWGSARQIPWNQPVSLLFTQKRITQYRYVQIEHPGYLILRKIASPFSVKCSIFSGRFPIPIINSEFFDQSIRVDPGKWVFSVFPEFRDDTSSKPVRIDVQFVPEFDVYEPNDTPESATELNLVPGTSLHLKTGLIGYRDRDYFCFTLKKKRYVRISDSRKQPPPEGMHPPRLRVLSQRKDGRHKACYQGPLDWMGMLLPGTYVIEFTAENNREYANPVPYFFDITMYDVEKENEPNDTAATATSVTHFPTVMYVRYAWADIDYYRLHSQAKGFVILSHQRKTKYNIFMRDETGQSPPPERCLPTAVWVTPEKDTLVRLAVESNHDDGHFITKRLPLYFNFLPAEGNDPYEPNNSLETAAPIPVDQTIEALS